MAAQPEPDPLAILEAILFVSDTPLALDRMGEVLEGHSTDEIASLVEILQGRYREGDRGLLLTEVAHGYRLVTKPEMAPWIQRLRHSRPMRLSKAALETLAIIAYRQPVTKSEIEAVRGVAIDGVLKTLIERDLVRILGRKADVGRPILYGTSRIFLEYFGFKDLSELPTLKEIEALAPSGPEYPVTLVEPDASSRDD